MDLENQMEMVVLVEQMYMKQVIHKRMLVVVAEATEIMLGWLQVQEELVVEQMEE